MTNQNYTIILNVQRLEWLNLVKQEVNKSDDDASSKSMPYSQSNCSGVHFDGLVYIFGGYG